ncbi:hypothetical protein EG328_012020 [Venturia inaequalis]|uniref:F-box domain-containing protein n=1 Tax=Venturia inaequalis TaxID=5025 RepID=A0A8H3Z4X3_VENIN|nr:hypothetical protein EG328_012020 [Venturia inaequalis]
MERQSSTKVQRGGNKQGSDLQPQVHDPQSILHPQASLLGIPVELRLQVLQYLLPDERLVRIRKEIGGNRPAMTIDEYLDGWESPMQKFKVYQARQTSSTYHRFELSEEYKEDALQGYIPLRVNLESCWPSVMRVNHQVYQECLPLVYNQKTFEAHIVNTGMSICSHEYQNYHSDKSLPELPLHVGRIESLNLVITHEIGMDREEVQNTTMLSACLANALAGNTTLRQIRITLEVYPCNSDSEYEYDTVRLAKTYEKDLTRLLRCFQQLRGLDIFGSIYPESGRDLLRDAWEASARSDTKAYEKVLEATKIRWRDMKKARIEKMMDEFDQQASVVTP